MTAEDVKNRLATKGLLYLKYVKTNGEYLFCDAGAFGVGHRDLVKKDQQPESAGFIKLYPDGFIVEGYSMTLNIGPDAVDVPNFAEMFNLPEKERY